jgi:hypothetical protein
MVAGPRARGSRAHLLEALERRRRPPTRRDVCLDGERELVGPVGAQAGAIQSPRHQALREGSPSSPPNGIGLAVTPVGHLATGSFASASSCSSIPSPTSSLSAKTSSRPSLERASATTSIAAALISTR